MTDGRVVIIVKIEKPRRAARVRIAVMAERVAAATHGELGLAQRRRYVQVVGDVHVAEIVRVLHAPHCQPIDRVHRQASGQLDFYVFSLVALQRLQTGKTEYNNITRVL